MKTYVASYFYEDGEWIGRVEFSSKGGANTQGRTLERCKANMREAVAAYLNCAEGAFELDDRVQLPTDVETALGVLKEAQERSYQAENAVAVATIHAAEAFRDAGFSLRDAGTVMDLVRSRIDQIIKDRVSLRDGAHITGHSVKDLRAIAELDEVLLADGTVPGSWIKRRLEIGAPNTRKHK